MDSTISSKHSLDSTFTCEESNGNLNLNNAMLMSVEDDILSNAGDEIFYDTNSPRGTFLKNFQPETNTSITNGAVQKMYISNFSNCTNSTNYHSLCSTKKQLNFNFFSMENYNSFPSCDMQHEQDANTEEEDFNPDKRVPLSVILRRMFDDIAKKCTKSGEKLTSFTKPSTKKCPYNSSLETKSDNTFLRNDDDPLYNEQKSDNSVASTESLEESCQSNSSSTQSTSMSFLSRILPRRLITILENSNESACETQMESFADHSDHVGRLPNFFLSKLRNPHYVQGKVFNTSDTNSSEHDISSSISSMNIEILHEEVIRKANNLRGNNCLISSSEISNEKKDNTFILNSGHYNRFSEFQNLETTGTDRLAQHESDIESHTNSVQSDLDTSFYLSDFEDSDDSSAFLSATDTDSIEVSTMNQSIDKKMINSTGGGIKTRPKEKNVTYNESPILTIQQKNNRSNFSRRQKISPLSTNRTENTRTKKIQKFLTPKKSTKKRRSLSLPDAAIEAENKTPRNRKCSNSKSLRKGEFYDRRNKTDRNDNSPKHRRSNSFNVITSPIKPVEYLRHFFNNIVTRSENSAKLSPMVRKFKKPRVPFISVTPATPLSRI